MSEVTGLLADLRDVLRRYLELHPEAADSLTGIRRWWLPKRLEGVTLEDLETAIATLVESGEMQRRTLPDSGELYSSGHQAKDH